MNYQLFISEGAQATGSASRVVHLERFEYEVLQPLFKNCRHYQPGEIIRLDRETAARFIANHDIKESS